MLRPTNSPADVLTITYLALIAAGAKTSFLTFIVQLTSPFCWLRQIIFPSISATTTTPKPAAVPEERLFNLTSHSEDPLLFNELILPLESLKKIFPDENAGLKSPMLSSFLNLLTQAIFISISFLNSFNSAGLVGSS